MTYPTFNLKLLNTEPNRYASTDLLSLINYFCDNIESDRAGFGIVCDYDILLICIRNIIDSEVLSRANRLKCIVTPTTGLNHIDVDLAQKLGIKIISLRGEVDFLKSITATAELAWGLLLSLVRKINSAHDSVIDGSWSRDLFYGSELNGLTPSIVGYGRLGKQMAI